MGLFFRVDLRFNRVRYFDTKFKSKTGLDSDGIGINSEINRKIIENIQKHLLLNCAPHTRQANGSETLVNLHASSLDGRRCELKLLIMLVEIFSLKMKMLNEVTCFGNFPETQKFTCR